ncbi:hypothetical protein [Mycobacteroides abscessus]|uniref:hypothetical protein n=1 Tax=Mycobacteroides abscessus TaxID=36809 RepID=UPI00266BA409|nr:hypothetical protein [Mycobacteroides abscessus]MDO3050692.1 hypothetical protein [Mycobacteroides abscessus subsp. abscessus]
MSTYYEAITESGAIQFHVWVQDEDGIGPVALPTEEAARGFIQSLADNPSMGTVVEAPKDI